MVGLKNLINTFDLWFIIVSIQWKTMIDLGLTHKPRDCSETETREIFELIVLLQNRTHFLDSLHILILVILRVETGLPSK